MEIDLLVYGILEAGIAAGLDESIANTDKMPLLRRGGINEVKTYAVRWAFKKYKARTEDTGSA